MYGPFRKVIMAGLSPALLLWAGYYPEPYQGIRGRGWTIRNTSSSLKPVRHPLGRRLVLSNISIVPRCVSRVLTRNGNNGQNFEVQSAGFPSNPMHSVHIADIASLRVNLSSL